MQEPLISVIVPVYKVEPYLRKCLDSIVNQSYRNLEIILVDDGSPDLCGAICDEYAAKDERIVVIHQENGGLSAARNAGLEVAKGEWLGFVDSDDWVDEDMFEYLLTNALQEKADIAVCGICKEYPARTVFLGWPRQQLLTKEEALFALLEDADMQNFVWNKLYKREMIGKIRFPVGRTFEDVAVSYRFFQNAETIRCLPDAKYHYLQRENSIMGDVSLKNRLNFYTATQERRNDLYALWPQMRDLLDSSCIAAAVGIWSVALCNPKAERQKYKTNIREISAFVKQLPRVAKQALQLGLAGRLVVQMVSHPTWWAFAFSWVIGQLYRKKHGRVL